MPKKPPLRKCVACREMREKKQLLRVVCTEGVIEYDERGKKNGRGAYLCRDEGCLSRAIKTRALERELSGALPEETIAALKAACGKAKDG